MLAAILNWLSGPLMKAIKPLCEFFAKFFSPLVAIILSVYEFVQWVSRTLTGREIKISELGLMYEQLKEATGTSVFGVFPPAISNAVAFLNYIFPVTEGLILLSLLSALYALCIAFRIIKSCIPSVA